MIQTVALLVVALFLQSAAPKAGPWKSLFDGKSLNAWRIFKTDKAPKMCDRPGAKDCWEIVDGVLQKDGHANDIASKEQFGDFELELEWNIGNASNSGVFYRGTDAFEQIYWSAPGVSAARQPERRRQQAGQPPRGVGVRPLRRSKDAAKPAGEWNQTRIVAKGKHVEHWLNGKKVASYDVGSPEWDAAIKASKFKPEKYPEFGRAPKGYLGIQGDHPGRSHCATSESASCSEGATRSVQVSVCTLLTGHDPASVALFRP